MDKVDDMVDTECPPFTPVDVIKLGSLAEALNRLVFRHPEVMILRARAIEAHRTSFYEDAGLIVPVFGHDEDMLPLKFFQREDDGDLDPEPTPSTAPEGDSDWGVLINDRPPEIAAVYDEIELRARTLMNMLQNREVIGVGHTVDGHLVTIASTIWSREDFYIHPRTGDICEAGPGTMTRRWIGVVLERPSTSSSLGSVEAIIPSPSDSPLRPLIAEASGQAPGGGRLSERARPKSARVQAALIKEGIDLASCDLSLKEVASRVAHRLPVKLRGRNEEEALRRMIGRLRKDARDKQ